MWPVVTGHITTEQSEVTLSALYFFLHLISRGNVMALTLKGSENIKHIYFRDCRMMVWTKILERIEEEKKNQSVIKIPGLFFVVLYCYSVIFN